MELSYKAGGGDVTQPYGAVRPPPPPPSVPPNPLSPGTAPIEVRTRRGPKVLIIIGGALTAIGAIAFVVGFVVIGATLFETVDEGLDPTSKLDLTVDLPGEGTVRLEPDRYQVVAVGPTLTTVSGRMSDAGGQDVDRLPFADPDVTVTGPDGQELALEPPDIERLSHAPGLDTVGLSEFTVTTAGDYTITVTGEPGPVTQVGIGEAKSLWEEAQGWVAGMLITFAGAGLGSIGFMLLLAGIIWWLIARSSTRMAV